MNNVDQLIEFLNYVDANTYILDGQRYWVSNNELVCTDELTNTFLSN